MLGLVHFSTTAGALWYPCTSSTYISTPACQAAGTSSSVSLPTSTLPASSCISWPIAAVGCSDLGRLFWAENGQANQRAELLGINRKCVVGPNVESPRKENTP